MIVDKKLAQVINIAIPCDRNIKEKEYNQLKKYYRLKEELEEIWKRKGKSSPSGGPKLVSTGSGNKVFVKKGTLLGTTIEQNSQAHRLQAKGRE